MNKRALRCCDCIHADVCEQNPLIPKFGRDNPALCKGFKNKADFAEVVRCGKCKYFDLDSWYCQFWHGARHPGHHCGEGERK